MSDPKTICKTAVIRREICIGWNDNNCFDSGRMEEEFCASIQKNQKIEEAFKVVLADKCKAFRRGMGPRSLSYQEAWLCELKKK